MTIKPLHAWSFTFQTKRNKESLLSFVKKFFSLQDKLSLGFADNIRANIITFIIIIKSFIFKYIFKAETFAIKEIKGGGHRVKQHINVIYI